MKRTKETTVKTAFAQYTLGEVLGEGGAGIVYAATDELGAQWAIKILRPERATRQLQRRFKREILFCERNCHANVLKIVDHGIATLDGGDAPFYVMHRYAGSLRRAMRRLLDPTSRLACFDQVLSGVEAAHLQGVVHRDLKPENILCDEAVTTLVIADFGIAHFIDEELYTAAETKPGDRLANFQYAAPEQKERGREVAAAADIFALGLMLNEFFTGSVPQGTSYRTIEETDPGYAWLDELVAAMIRQRPEERPESIDAVKRALIAHRQDYVTRQQLDELRKSVEVTTAVTDPLANSPPRVVDFEWGDGQLALILDKPVNERWVEALRGMGSFTAVMGKEPERFRFSGDRACIPAQEDSVQEVVNHFKRWMQPATERYSQRLDRERQEAEEQVRKQLRAAEEELERRRRLRATVRL